MLDDRLRRLALEDLGELGDLVDPLRRVRHADLGEDPAFGLDEEDVDARVDVEEHLREVPRTLRVVPRDCAGRRRVEDEDARRERQDGDVVVELLLETSLGAGDPIVHLVDQLPVENPRQDGERREHDHGGKRDERRELGADGREAGEHEPCRAYRRWAALGERFARIDAARRLFQPPLRPPARPPPRPAA